MEVATVVMCDHKHGRRRTSRVLGGIPTNPDRVGFEDRNLLVDLESGDV